VEGVSDFDAVHAEIQAREELLRAAVRVLAAERSEPHAHSDDEASYAAELLALAARDLVEAVDRLPASRRPDRWKRRLVCATCGEVVPPGKVGAFSGDDCWCEGHIPDDVKVPF
jgi:hypothetical protein